MITGSLPDDDSADPSSTLSTLPLHRKPATRSDGGCWWRSG
jgi:hypothetical protein